jgi:hypothetical protein
MRILLSLVVVALVSCAPAPTVRATVEPSPTPTASAIPTPEPAVAPTAQPTAPPPPPPTEEPLEPDPILFARANTWVSQIDLPKPFPVLVGLVNNAGPFQAHFAGFRQDGTAVLSIGRRAVWSNILTHEFGHAWHTKYMGEDLTRWGEYAKIRGYVAPTDPIRLIRDGGYTDDWRERFALDFQWAFNPDYSGRFMPNSDYWPKAQFDEFRAWVRALPTRPLPAVAH